MQRTPRARAIGLAICMVATACARAAVVSTGAGHTMTAVERTRLMLSALADDSMEGRGTGTRGSARAARLIEQEMRAIGLVAAGDSGYFQRVPMAMVSRAQGQPPRITLMPSFAVLDTVAVERRRDGVNIVGIIQGSDDELSKEAILIDAHYDHVGIRAAVNGDSIYNGADDDASGTTAVVEIARAIAAGPRPKRTLIFLATTGEEVGLLGTRWYIQNPVFPLAQTVANLEIEMIGRPDSLAGGPGRGWLTGYERSTMGDMFAAAGLPIVPDKRPQQNFFQRSDNIAFARMGIVAHTLSSFNLHTDYHRPSDTAERSDFAHMAALIEGAARAVRLLADGPRPEWKPGGKP